LPTAFIASYGKSKPIIGIVGEYDALPGLSQKAAAKQGPVKADARNSRGWISMLEIMIERSSWA
jgi:aminobenzoyl-glutamate utilization protein B